MRKRDVGGAAAVRFENPLMPDERLRQMYTAMVQMRMLEEHLVKGRAGKKRAAAIESVRGEEAARASTALSLGAGDVLSDGSTAPAMDLLLGAKLHALKRPSEVSAKNGAGVRAIDAGGTEGGVLRLVRVKDAEEQLSIAIGAAELLKAQGAGRVLLVYVGAGAADKKHWKRALTAVGGRELPVIFVALPGHRERDLEDAGELSRRSRSWGVPGFPVDGTDAVGMYRVMQESLLRGRSAGGPALIECVPFRVEGSEDGKIEDGINRLEGLLLAKGVATREWMRRTRATFSGRLGR